MPPVVKSHSLRLGEMGDVVCADACGPWCGSMLKLKEMNSGGGAEVGERGGDEGESSDSQSAMSASSSSRELTLEDSSGGEFSDGAGSDSISLAEMWWSSSDSLKLEKSMAGKTSLRPSTGGSSGNFGGASIYSGIAAKCFSSSIVERSVVSCVVRFSAALTNLSIRPLPVFFSVLFSNADEALDSVPRHFGSRKPKSAFFLGLCLVFQWQADGKSHWCSQFLCDLLAGF